MILHDHRVTTRLLVRQRANACGCCPRRHPFGRCGRQRRRRGARRAGIINQAHGECLPATVLRQREMRWRGLHFVPEREREQRLQCQGQSQRGRQRPLRQRRRLSPAPVGQCFACSAVEPCQAARAVPFQRMSDLPGTFDAITSFKQSSRRNLRMPSAHVAGEPGRQVPAFRVPLMARRALSGGD